MKNISMLLFIFCTSTSALASVNFIGNQKPKEYLESIGGEFSHRIENFQGVKQKKSNWCWAAVTEMIFSYLTGEHLDQKKLSLFKIRENFQLPTNWQYRDLIELTNDNCPKNYLFGDMNGCNRTGITQATLDYLDTALPKEKIPNMWSAELFKVLRNSVENDVPFGIIIQESDKTHIVAVYGVHYSISTTTGNLDMKFDIYDPNNGALVTMDATTQEYRSETFFYIYSGYWTGLIALADFNQKGVSSVPAACPFLTDKDQKQFCHN